MDRNRWISFSRGFWAAGQKYWRFESELVCLSFLGSDFSILDFSIKPNKERCRINQNLKRSSIEANYRVRLIFLLFHWFRMGLGSELMNGISYLREKMHTFSYPCCILHGKKDKILDYLISVRFHAKIARFYHFKPDFITI